MVNAALRKISGHARLNEIWSYDIKEDQWHNLGPFPEELKDIYQNGMIPLEDPAITGFEDFDMDCPPPGKKPIAKLAL